MVSTTRGTISRAAAEKAEGKKPAAEKGSGSRKDGSGVMKGRDYAEIFDQMSFVGTRYPDKPTMIELGIFQDCHFIFEEMQLARLMMNPQPAYQKETIEFLSTLRVNFYEPDEFVPESNGSGKFSFRINKRKYRMSFRELEDVFHFNHKNGRETEPGTPQAELQAFWAMIGVGEYMPSTAKSTHIRNPVLRYVHKALAHTIYVRRDVTGVTEKELFFLNEGMKRVIRTLPDGTEMVGDRTGNSLATYLLKSFLSYREYALSLNKVHKASSGQLSCGGVITPILINRGITLEKPVDPLAINIQYLRKSTYLRGQPISGHHNYQFAYRQFEYGLASFFPPNPPLTYITVMENIDFEPPIETILEQGQEEEEYAYPGAAGKDESSGDEAIDLDYKTGGFFFKDHEIKGRKSAANTAFESINTLKAWNQFQDKAIKSLLKTVKKMGKRIKELTRSKSKSPSRDSTHTPPIHLGSFHDEDVVEDSENDEEGNSKFQTAETSTRKRKASKSPQASTKDDSTSSSSSETF